MCTSLCVLGSGPSECGPNETSLAGVFFFHPRWLCLLSHLGNWMCTGHYQLLSYKLKSFVRDITCQKTGCWGSCLRWHFRSPDHGGNVFQLSHTFISTEHCRTVVPALFILILLLKPGAEGVCHTDSSGGSKCIVLYVIASACTLEFPQSLKAYPNSECYSEWELLGSIYGVKSGIEKSELKYSSFFNDFLQK